MIPARLFAVGLSALMLSVAPAALAQAVQPLALGDEAAGALTDADARTDDHPHDDYRLALAAGQRLEATLRSADFDAYLELYREGADAPAASDDDGLGEETDARLRFTAPEAGVYVLRARAFSSEERGDYLLTVVERPVAPAAERPRAVRIGSETRGRLDEGAAEDEDGRPYRDFTLRLNRDQRLTARLASDDFDPVLRIGRMERGVFQMLAENDDGPDGLNSCLVFTAPARGDYVIRATALGGAEGDFVLSLAEGPQPAQASEIAFGQSVDGRLDDQTPENGAGQKADVYRFVGREGQRVRLSLASSDFDAYLELFRQSENGPESLGADDDGAGQGTDARLIQVLPADGVYLVEARAFGGRGEGNYRLSLEELPPPPAPSPLAFGQTVQGELTVDAAVDVAGRPYVAYRFSAVQGQRVQAVMRSGDFDAYLEVGAADADFVVLASDDDGLGEGTDARLNFVAPEDGEYEIRALPLASTETGLFSLELIDRGPRPKPGSILVGAAVNGALSEDDALTDEGAYADLYRLQAKAGEKLRLILVSNEFDAFLEVGRGEDAFTRLAFDDDGLSDTHARLDWNPPEDGEYVIRVRSYGPNQTGAYALIVERQP